MEALFSASNRRVITSLGNSSYTAETDLVLVLAIVTMWADPTAGPFPLVYSLVISSDPDLSGLATSYGDAFQLEFVSDPLVNTRQSLELAFPLLKGQTIYWNGSAMFQLVQLIFS